LNCDADFAHYQQGGSVMEEMRADYRAIEILCTAGFDGPEMATRGLETLYQFNLGLIGNVAYPTKDQRLAQARLTTCDIGLL
jgi:hypothetical protein